MFRDWRPHGSMCVMRSEPPNADVRSVAIPGVTARPEVARRLDGGAVERVLLHRGGGMSRQRAPPYPDGLIRRGRGSVPALLRSGRECAHRRHEGWIVLLPPDAPPESSTRTE